MLVSDSETESDDNLSKIAVAVDGKQGEDEAKRSFSADEVARPFNSKQSVDRDALVKLAKKYQKHMQNKPIPTSRLNKEIMVVNWKGLAKTLERMYGQPLHYLTHKLCKEWDKSRFGSKNEEKPLNAIINWRDAEDTIWKVEAVHRLCTSPIHLAMLWLDDPTYHIFVNEVITAPSSSIK
ncbi:hypothetical protein AAZX31_19G038800 [Glycine max]|uniref:Protein RDM1 n=2 Tax=Glycine subgen. Soja TaxID=1462606 RepID=A0A0R0ETU3_SOYBN|nr:protein RDM1-like [Glycine soja]KAG4911882.1 hypothetical protein JHK86_052315 [Glycine max]KAG4926683.1 hypothetical protein JHK85_053169 [Glycine max]KAG5082317.1 hypothetical protein JHK84_052355 [Glycine max]KAG5085075.1 hypothetical protein JHK82_052472 [Glycine max]KAH1076361.1 hypothetical protein GYH30_052021 [Glycine max]